MLLCCKRRNRKRAEIQLKPDGFIPGTGSQDALDNANTIPLSQLELVGVATKSTETLRLEPTISLGNGITIIVGTIIGAGIFISPQGVLVNTGSIGLTLLVWLLSGAYSAVGAWCYVELGLMIRKSGADYAYLYEAFGPFLAFLRLWVESMVVRPAVQALVALSCSNYVLNYAMSMVYGDGVVVPDSVKILVATAIILMLTFVNCYSVRLAIRLQDIFTYGVLVGLVLIVSVGMWYLLQHFLWFISSQDNMLATWNNLWKEIDSPARKALPQISSVAQVSIACYDALLAYNGWNYLNYVIEELREPERNLGRAVGVSISLVTVIYLLANISFLAVLTTTEMASAMDVGNIFAKHALGPVSFVIPLAVMFSSLGTVNGVLFTTSRLFYVGAREGHMPQLLTMLHIERLTPVPAVLIVTIISLVYLALADLYQLITYISICVWLAIGVVVFSLIWMRFSRPHLKRPVKVWLGWPIMYCLATLYLIVMPIYVKPAETGVGLILIATGVPVYVLLVMWKKPAPVVKGIDAFTKCMQRIMLVAPGEMDDVNGPSD